MQIGDRVKHKRQDETGIIISRYPGSKLAIKDPNRTYLDIRLDNNTIYYCTAEENWTVTNPVETLE